MYSDTKNPLPACTITRFFSSVAETRPVVPEHFRLEAIISKSCRRKRRQTPRISGTTAEIPWYWSKPED
ncbi:hypothetical protein JGX82_004691 [Salmonella enterica]|uniref:Uncharacterized protein n=1 Tax=Salmonella enterica TaxID=28901 RepID=A0A5V2QXL4_SALER|nr:hypothetical protein [Salmonella enterica]ECG5420827.1 hypothetical protein [Salmonella enterica subsp. enterica serovar Abaetetuba]ECS4147603.1 hypothetical protein [Salmonella enterica subsp. enterica serovar Urbana]ECW9664906.1 hypothetical protein [Salmonella enterica subsp. enterica serovar Poona]EDI2722035.1 hypothetical protein [Salmonella enterica subsp. enterica serovar Rubislaw]EDQ6565855.1 hypothetical protein [Salmonella enterica subsp. houtenae]EDU7668358.1 hypothetical protei